MFLHCLASLLIEITRVLLIVYSYLLLKVNVWDTVSHVIRVCGCDSVNYKYKLVKTI